LAATRPFEIMAKNIYPSGARRVGFARHVRLVGQRVAWLRRCGAAVVILCTKSCCGAGLPETNCIAAQQVARANAMSKRNWSGVYGWLS
jgi:hypothetical protein